MKKKQYLLVAITVVLMGMLYGCMANGESKEEVIGTEDAIVEEAVEEADENNAGTEEMEDLSTSGEGVIIKTEAVSAEALVTDVPMVELPEKIEGIKAETEAYPDLEKLIIEYYEIPDDFMDTTSYYYNYVDLNDDGDFEIFVVVNGPYTSGTGGSSALWIVENGGQLHVNQDFTLINTPIIISDKLTNGTHELIVPYMGGGAESQYKILTCSDGFFTTMNDAEGLKTIDDISGKAIIANDIIGEITNGIEGLKLKGN
jgi:hypothetical protein